MIQTPKRINNFLGLLIILLVEIENLENITVIEFQDLSNVILMEL